MPPYTLYEGSPEDLELTSLQALHQISQTLSFKHKGSPDFVLGEMQGLVYLKGTRNQQQVRKEIHAASKPLQVCSQRREWLSSQLFSSLLRAIKVIKGRTRMVTKTAKIYSSLGRCLSQAQDSFNSQQQARNLGSATGNKTLF